MRISRQTWKNYAKQLNDINSKAAEELFQWIEAYGVDENGLILDNITEALDKFDNSFIDECNYIVKKYGDASGALSATMYDAIASIEGASVDAAEIAEAVPISDIYKTVNGVLKTSHNPDEMTGAVSRLVKRVGADTMLQNAKRDGAEFAWIPIGDTCAFCIALASRGWQKVGENTLKNGHAEHIHSNCDCNYAVRFDGKSNVEGYDPDKYLEMYNSADGSSKDKINALRRMINEKNKNQNLHWTPTITKTSAKTIEEAENIIKQYIDESQFAASGVSLKGISVESANVINDAIISWYNNFDVQKLGGVVAPAMNTKEGKLISNAQAAYNPIRNSLYINRQSCKTPQAVFNELKADEALTKDFLNNPSKYDTKKISSRVLKCLENSAISGRSKVTEDLTDVVNHELGHATQRYVYKHSLWDEVRKNMEKYAPKVSGYACDDEDEYIAESFCSFMKGEDKIDPTLRKIFVELRRK